MADRYATFTHTAPGRFLTRRLGLPQPVPLRRWSPRHPAIEGPVLLLTAGDIPLPGLHESLTRTGLPPHSGPLGSRRPAAVVLDATGVRTVAALMDVHATLHPVVRSMAPCGRVVVLGAPLSPADHHQAAAQQAHPAERRVVLASPRTGRRGTPCRIGRTFRRPGCANDVARSPRSCRRARCRTTRSPAGAGGACCARPRLCSAPLPHSPPG